MRIFFSILIIAFLCSGIILDAPAKDVLEEKISEEVLRRQIKNEYFGKINKASLMQRKVLGYRESKYGVNSVETLGLLEGLAWMSMEQQDFKEAEMFYQRVIKIRKELLPSSDDNTNELAVAYFTIGDSYLYRSQYVKAVDSYDESLSIATNHAHRGDTLSRKGIAYEGLEDHQNAVGTYLEALKEYDAARTFNPRNSKSIDKRVLIVYRRLPELYHKLGENRKVKEYQDLIKDMKRRMEAERKAEKDGL